MDHQRETLCVELICKFTFINAKSCKFQSTDIIRFVNIRLYRSGVDLIQLTKCWRDLLYEKLCLSDHALLIKLYYQNNNNASVALQLFWTVKGLLKDPITIPIYEKWSHASKKPNLCKCNQSEDTNRYQMKNLNVLELPYWKLWMLHMDVAVLRQYLCNWICWIQLMCGKTSINCWSFFLYKMAQVQQLPPNDAETRVHFSHLFLAQMEVDNA